MSVAVLLWLACAAPTLPANPLASVVRTPGATAVSGPVAEVVRTGSYAYVRVGTAWFATMGAHVAPGATVTLRPVGQIEGFHSARLDRTFDVLTFTSSDVHQP